MRQIRWLPCGIGLQSFCLGPRGKWCLSSEYIELDGLMICVSAHYNQLRMRGGCVERSEFSLHDHIVRAQWITSMYASVDVGLCVCWACHVEASVSWWDTCVRLDALIWWLHLYFSGKTESEQLDLIFKQIGTPSEVRHWESQRR